MITLSYGELALLAAIFASVGFVAAALFHANGDEVEQ
jgi:hypothetical protein